MRRLKTLRRPPIYPKTPGHLPCSSLTHPLPLSSRRPSVSFGGFGLRDADFYDTDLAKADLSQSVVDEEQLRDARGLVGATMPDGVTMTEEKWRELKES